MTISFSYAYLNGLLRLIVLGSPANPSSLSGARSLPVVIAVHLSSRAMSPRRTEAKRFSRRPKDGRDDGPFMRTVSATSSALWPVTT